MNIEIVKDKEFGNHVVIFLNSKDYWLRKNTDDPEWQGEYVLTYRIDMDYAGKPDQEGGIKMYLDEREVEKFRKAGFQEIS